MMRKTWNWVQIPLVIWFFSRMVVLFSWVILGVVKPGEGIKNQLLKWDGIWYYSIVTDGYSVSQPIGQSNIAFFPGLPNVVRLIAWLPGVSTFRAAFLVSNLFGLFAVCLFWKFVQTYIDDQALKLTAIALFALTPGSVVFSMLYSEGLFISLSIMTLLLLHQKRFYLASVTTIFAGLVRPSGIVLVVVMVVAITKTLATTKNFRLLVAAVMAPIGILSYATYLHFRFGSFKLYFETQRLGWGEHFSLTARSDDFSQFITWILNGFGGADFNRVVPGGLILIAVVGLTGCIRLRLPVEVITYTVGIIALAFFSATLGLRPRFLMTAFPIFLGISYFSRTLLTRYMYLVLSVLFLTGYSIITAGYLYQTP